MVRSRSPGLALLIALTLSLVGCAREDGQKIIGKWRAERLEVMSLKLPLGPELQITSNEVMTGTDITIPISAITQDGNEVTLDTDALIGLTFYFVEADRMYVDLPVIGRIYYRRVHDPAGSGSVLKPAAVVQRRQPVAPVASSAPTSPSQSIQTRGVHGLADAEAAYAQAYAQALALARQDDQDGAVRSLHEAFRLGFRDRALLERSPEFDVLRNDVRYQALVTRYGGH